MSGLLTPEMVLEHWEGHRRLTRRTIEAFPEDRLFAYTPTKPLRTFGEMMLEVLEVVEPNLRGFLSGEWVWKDKYTHVNTERALLDAWDETGYVIRDYWARIPLERLLAVEPGYFYGGPPDTNLNRVLYFIDNEIHHRAQGFVYLRLLGLEPPAFYER
jgi:uncharacterized damage-inducible protein DinB